MTKSEPRPSLVKKPWGTYQIVHEEPKRHLKILSVDPGQSLSLQSHEQRSEHWFVLTGEATVTVDGNTRVLRETNSIDIPVGSRHRLSNNAKGPLRIAEVQYGDTVDERDSIRYADRYGRRLGKERTERIELTPPVTICEIGCNHKGEMSIAEEMIKVAVQFCNADVIKFQKRTNRQLLTDEEYNAAHPVPANAYGETYGEHREHLELDLEQHRTLKHWCEEWGAVYSTSVWDLTSAKEIVSLNPDLIKIPSAINTNQNVLNYLFKDFQGEVHISLGMTKRKEEEGIVAMAERYGRASDVVLYHCISGYPVEHRDLFLLELPRLIDAYGGCVKAVGFSGHHKGIAADIAALALGATYFERHFTLDRTWKGTDHAASLEPDGFRRLVRDLNAVNGCLRVKDIEILPLEEVQRNKLKRFSTLDDD